MADTAQTPVATFSFATTLPTTRRSLHSRHLLLLLSYLIEDSAARVPGTTLIATFQRQSLVRPQLTRYHSLTSRFKETYILGLPDANLPALPNTTVIPLEPTWPLMHEWVVIATGPACCVALFAFDGDASQPTQRSHHFHALWSSDTAVIDTAYEAFITALGHPYHPIKRDRQAVLQTTRQIRQDIHMRLRAVNKKM